jgi:hypothetical protein
MVNHLTLLTKIKPYRVGIFPGTSVADMAKAYQPAEMGGGGRTTHEDWWLPFLRDVERTTTAYMVPLGFRKKAGNAKPIMVPVLNPKWTFAPGAKVELRPFADHLDTVPRQVPWVETMDMVHPLGPGETHVWSIQEAWLGEKYGWTECYETHSYLQDTVFWGKRKVIWYQGLKLDCNPRDLMAHYPEVSFSVKKVGVL